MDALTLRKTGQVTMRYAQDIPEPVVSRTYQQFGIFVNDGSTSMAHQALNGMEKRVCVGMATAETFMRFQSSTKRNNFSFAIVDFDDEAECRMGITPAGEVNPYEDYTPDPPGRGRTSIAAGLMEAEMLVRSFLNAQEDVAKSVVIIVLSDGMDDTPRETLQIAARLKAKGNVSIYACFLAERGRHDAEAEHHLRTIASDPVRNYRTVYDPDTIRGFFMASLSAGNRL